MKIIKLFCFFCVSAGVFAASGQNNSQVSFSNPAMQTMKFWGNKSKEYMYLSMNTSRNDYSYTGSAFSVNGSAFESRRNVIPEFEYVKKCSDRLVFALKYGVPLFFNTGYSDTAAYTAGFATERTTRTNNLSPEFAYIVNPKLTVGAGLDMMGLKLFIYNSVPGTGLLKDDLYDSKFGYHVGLVLNQPWVGSFLGLSYYSPIGFNLHGHSTLGNSSSEISSYIKSPWNVKLELLQALSATKMLFLNWQYTNWGSIDSITINPVGGQPITEQLGYVGTSKTSFGAIVNSNSYRIMGGLSYDVSPAKGSLRTANSLEPETFWTGGIDFSKIIDDSRVGISYGRLLNHTTHDINGQNYQGKVKIKADSIKLYYNKSF